MPAMVRDVRVVVMGLGHVGCALARTVLGEPGLRLVGAVDKAPQLAGRSLAEVIDDRRARGIFIQPSLGRAPRADVLVLTTSSRLGDVARDVLGAVRRGLHVVTSCEELAHPWSVDPRLGARLDRAARRAGVAVLATGVNPGFALDRLVLTLAWACLGVERVCARRVVDLATRRVALRQKVGVGRSLAEFEADRRAGCIGHVGLGASAWLVADGLGFAADRFVERVVPVVAKKRLRGPGYDVPPGAVAGVRHEGVLLERRTPRVLLNLELSVEAKSPHDAVMIEGPVPLSAFIPGGLPGDSVTVATLVRGIAAARASQPGLVTPADLRASPVPRNRP
jgi:4-hydroxy-tetrahydrodipicolinate reductase